jgi:hypothetical protein
MERKIRYNSGGEIMPFSTLNDAQNNLWESVYNSSKSNGDTEEISARKAWAAISRTYKKVGDKWVKKSDSVKELSMTITSVPFDKSSGEMRWKAVASDTDKDLYDDSMSHELYRSFLDNIEKNVPPPEPFGQFVISNWWKGGTPYLSLSHFSDLDGEAVPGKVDSIYEDGKCLKAKGSFSDTNLGRACWKALNKDFADRVPDDRKIRISIAFLDLAHRHGDGKLFERKSLSDFCKECANGVGDIVYLKGYLVHLAMTRVPVNPRAEMEVEKSMSKKTREEDAASIIGEEEAKKLAEKSAVVGRSDILIEKADVPIVENAVCTDEKDDENDDEEELTDEEKLKQLEEKKSDIVEVPVPETVDTVSTIETEEPKVLPETSDPNPQEPDEIQFDAELKALSEAVKKVMSAPATSQEKMKMVEPEIRNLGTAIEKAFSSEAEKPKEESSGMTVDVVRSLIQESNQPLVDTLTAIQATLAGLNRPVVQESNTMRTIPKPRSPDPGVMRALVDKINGEAKPKSVLDICRTSVGLQ